MFQFPVPYIFLSQAIPVSINSFPSFQFWKTLSIPFIQEGEKILHHESSVPVVSSLNLHHLQDTKKRRAAQVPCHSSKIPDFKRPYSNDVNLTDGILHLPVKLPCSQEFQQHNLQHILKFKPVLDPPPSPRWSRTHHRHLPVWLSDYACVVAYT